MSLSDYALKRDNFYLHQFMYNNHKLAFPCCCCRSQDNKDNEEPCRTCDHNANAVKEKVKEL